MIEWSKVASDINKYTKSVFREDGQTITDSELEDALNLTFCIMLYTKHQVFISLIVFLVHLMML